MIERSHGRERYTLVRKPTLAAVLVVFVHTSRVDGGYAGCWVRWPGGGRASELHLVFLIEKQVRLFARIPDSYKDRGRLVR